ncbi:heterogeneous nuclear ribonucleoprotein 27C isoform X2 [Hylaeus volcanicus]|uniref:heterogeneous nuclear ribonucleoprotein 27C isoform X2 n=1 Tax=Hylaeus volcanicus TaxID=313075 RepID=UPI0023B803CE|nr:heterogeneous nuclear ribonucleoprotein 27C isoform X2 [Hylaeus volcanicus]
MRVKTEMDDDEKGKLFVGGLSWETTQENLQRYFGRYGEVIDCVVMKNSESGRSRGFGFVTFSDPANVPLVLQNGPHQLDGRTIDPKPCNPRTQQKPKRSGGFPKVFLGGLPSNVTETDLRSFFTRFGKVMEVVIMYDQEKKKSRGFGFLSFEDEDAVDRCVAEHFVNLNGKQVEIKRAEPRDSSSKMNDSHQGQWGPPQPGGPPMGMAGNMGPMGGPNGHVGGPMMGGPMGPPGNMMQQYQGWGTSPQTGGYAGYTTQYNSQGWGAPPGPPQQQQIPPPPHHQWSSSYNVQPAAATQGYGSYGGPAAAASGGYGPTAGTGGAAGGGPGGSWNSWNMPQNGPPPGTQPPPQPPQPNSSQPNSNSNPSGPQGDMYSRQTTGSGAPGSSSSSAKTPDYTGYSAYGNYADTSYPQRSYQGGESNQDVIPIPKFKNTETGSPTFIPNGDAAPGPQRFSLTQHTNYHPYRR